MIPTSQFKQFSIIQFRPSVNETKIKNSEEKKATKHSNSFVNASKNVKYF